MLFFSKFTSLTCLLKNKASFTLPIKRLFNMESTPPDLLHLTDESSQFKSSWLGKSAVLKSHWALARINKYFIICKIFFILYTIGAVGNTPLIKLNNASEMTGCNIMVKAEMLNPGGSVKDRAAYYLIREAEKRGEVQPGGTIVEGSFYLFIDIRTLKNHTHLKSCLKF